LCIFKLAFNEVAEDALGEIRARILFTRRLAGDGNGRLIYLIAFIASASAENFRSLPLLIEK
jgi:hypothetical protein